MDPNNVLPFFQKLEKTLAEDVNDRSKLKRALLNRMIKSRIIDNFTENDAQDLLHWFVFMLIYSDLFEQRSSVNKQALLELLKDAKRIVELINASAEDNTNSLPYPALFRNADMSTDHERLNKAIVVTALVVAHYCVKKVQTKAP